MSNWRPIKTIPEGEHVLLWFPNGERGIGGMECGTCYWEGDTLGFWTNGGPNSGLDWETSNREQPTHWRRLPPPPQLVETERWEGTCRNCGYVYTVSKVSPKIQDEVVE